MRVDGRVAEANLWRDRQGTAGPWTGLLVGYTVGTFCAIGALAMTSVLADIRADIHSGQYNELSDDDGDGDVDRDDLRWYRNLAFAYAGASIASLAGGALFNWLLVHRMNARGRADGVLRGREVDRPTK